MSSTASDQTITITPTSTIAADSYVLIALSGNINIASVVLVYATPAVTYTVTYKANGGTGDDVVDSKASKVAANTFTAPEGKVFDGWNTVADGTGTSYAVGDDVTGNLTLYAQWLERVAPTSGKWFSLEFVNGSEVKMSDGETLALTSTYATITGGSASIKYFNSGKTNQTVITSAKKISYGTNNMYLKLELDWPLQAGDVIAVADGSGKQIAIATTDGAPSSQTNKETTTSYEYTVKAGDNLIGEQILYLGRAESSGTTHGTVTITRLATHSVTYNLGAATGGTVPTQAAIAEGKTFTVAAAPADLVAPEGQEFKCWNDGTTNYNAGATYTMGTADVTLTAQYQTITVKYTVTYDLGAATGGTAPTQEGLAEGATFTVAAAPADLVAPANKVFKCWNDGTTDYNAGATYTMGAANVTLTAQYQDYFAVYDVTGLSYNEFVLTQANINNAANGFVSVASDNWQEQTPVGYSKADYYNLSSTSRNVTFKVKGAENFMVVVLGGGGDRSCDIKVGSGDATRVSVPKNTTITSQLFETGSTDEVTITIQGTGNSVYPAAIIFNVPNTTITLNNNGFSTFSSAYDFTFSGAQAYQMALDMSASTLTGTEVTGKVKAGEGILFKGDSQAEVTVVKTTGAAALTGNNLKGTTDANGNTVEMPAGKTVYVLSGDTFKKYTGTALAANKAFFQVDGTTVEGRSFVMVFDGETTGIDALLIDNGQLTIDNAVYNLNGQRVMNPAKGLYIVNGRKVVIK